MYVGSAISKIVVSAVSQLKVVAQECSPSPARPARSSFDLALRRTTPCAVIAGTRSPGQQSQAASSPRSLALELLTRSHVSLHQGPPRSGCLCKSVPATTPSPTLPRPLRPFHL